MGSHAFECAGDAALHQWSRFFEIKPQHPVQPSCPGSLCILRQQSTSLKSDPEIVHSKINRVGMWDIDRDERNTSGRDLIADDGCHLLVHLELNDQIDSAADKLFRIPHRDCRIVMVVEHQQLHAGIHRGCLQAFRDRLRKRHLCRLAAEPKHDFARVADGAVKTVLRLSQVAAVRQSLQDAVDRGLRDLRPLINRLKRQWPVFPLNNFEDIERF